MAVKQEPPSLEAIFGHTQIVESRVETLERGFETVSTKIDKLFQLVSAYTSQSPWRVGDVLSISRDLLTIGAILGGTIIFIANAISAGPISGLQKDIQAQDARMQRIERVLEKMTEQRVAKNG